MNFSLAGKSILIVEDFLSMRKAIRDMLYTLEADHIVEADNGTDAIHAMSKNSFELVLCDYNLGLGQNGQQVLEEVRHRKLIAYDCVFIIVSEGQEAGMVLGAMDHKPDEYLAKPFNAKQLSIRLERNFARKSYLLSVQREIDRGNLQKAIQNCEALLKQADKKMHHHLYKLRAELASTTGDFATAKKIYQQILDNRALPWANLGLGITEFQQNNLDLAIEIFENLLKEQPMYMEAYDWLSKAYEMLNNLQAMQKVLDQAVDLSPQSILRQKKLAETAHKNGDLTVAEQAYLATLQLGKHSIHKSSTDFTGLAKLYSAQNASDAAFNVLASMRAEFKNNPEAELRAAIVETELYHLVGDQNLSDQALEKVTRLSQHLNGKMPKDLHLDVVKSCLLNNQDEAAKHMLHDLLNTYIEDETFLHDVRRMHKEIGRENHSETLIQQTQQFLRTANNKGVELYQKGQYQEAMALFEQASARMPENKTIVLNMLKVVIHDLKAAEFNQDKLLRAKELFIKAAQINIESHRIAALKAEFVQICQQYLTVNQA